MAWRRTLVSCAIGAVVVAGCGRGGVPTEVTVPFPVALTINGEPTGTFFCHDGLQVATQLVNPTGKAVQMRGLTLELASPECGDHDVTLQASGTVAAGGVASVRRVDLAGDLCSEPGGRPGCTWDVTARVDTDAGVATGELWFATFRADHRSCGLASPRLLQPVTGAILSGDVTLALQPAPADDPTLCATPGTQIRIYPLYGGPPVLSDFVTGATYDWDTRGVRNADYLITAQKACGNCERCACGGVDAPITVSVQN